MDIVANLKALTEAGHHVHLGKVKAHAGIQNNILADAAAKQVVTQKIIDAGGDLNDSPDEDLAAAGIDSTCHVSINAHEHHEWPLYPIPEHKGVDMKALLEMEVLLQDGPWPDGFSPEEQENLARLAPKCHSQPPDACQDGAVDDKWQARNLTTSLSKALRRSCQLGYSDRNSLYARLWQDANPMLVPAISHLFWEHFTRNSRKMKTCTVRTPSSSGMGPSGMPKWPDIFKSPILGRHLMAGVHSARTWTLARMSLGPAPIGCSKGYTLNDTLRLLQLLERPSWKEPKVAAWQC